MTSNSPPQNSPIYEVAGRRVAWITPGYPPDRGGVSDHSSALVSTLRAAGHEVLVCSRPHETGFAQLDTELRSYRPDLVVVAYTPLAYAPRTGGVAPAFVRWCIGLRKRFHCQAILLAHEASLPVAFHWQRGEQKLAVLGIAQFTQFSLLMRCFDTVLFSNEGTRLDWAQHFKGRADRLHTLRICSNIPVHESSDPAADLTAAGYSVPSPAILFFGTGHPTVLLDYVEEAFLAISKVEPDAGLVIVGMDAEKLRQLQPSLLNLGARVQALGYVTAPEVSLWLQAAKLVLAPLVEGVTTRKGTVMAALQHGQTVVTTMGFHTRADVAWDDICIHTAVDRGAFAAAAVKASQDAAWRAEIGRAARAEYEARASPAVTAARILEYADQQRGRAARRASR
jgi:glycosyltransferase involved in cell wall biosynthesis